MAACSSSARSAVTTDDNGRDTVAAKISGDPDPLRFRAADMAGNIVSFDPRMLSDLWRKEFEDDDISAPSPINKADKRWNEQNRQLKAARCEQKKNGGVGANGTGAISYLVETLQNALAANLTPKPPPSLVMLFPLEWPAEHEPSGQQLQLGLGDETMAETALAWQTTWTLEPQYLAAPAHFRFAIEGPDRFRPACKDLALAVSSGVHFWFGFQHHFGNLESDFIIDRELLLTSCVKHYEAVADFERGAEGEAYPIPLDYDEDDDDDIGDFSKNLANCLPGALLVRSLPTLFPGGELVWPADFFGGLKLLHRPCEEFPQGRPYSWREHLRLMSTGWAVVTRALEKRGGGDVLKNVFGSTEAAFHKARRCVADVEKSYRVFAWDLGCPRTERSLSAAAALSVAIHEEFRRETGTDMPKTSWGMGTGSSLRNMFP